MGSFKQIATTKGMSYDPRKLRRTGDANPSKDAARYMVRSGKLKGQCLVVYEALKKYQQRADIDPEFRFPTARELSKASGLDYHMIARRLPNLKQKGMAQITRERICKFDTTGIPVQEWSTNDQV